MATELLAIGSTVGEASADFTITAGNSAIIYLKDAAGPAIETDALVHLQIKDGTDYFTVLSLRYGDSSRKVLGDDAAITTYRLVRAGGTVGVGRVS